MASVGDKLTDTRNAARPVSARVSVARASGATSLTCNDLTGWPTASKVHFVTYQIDSNSNPVAGTQIDFYGIVSGSSVGSLTVVDGTDNGNAVNDVVEMLPTAGWGQDLSEWGMLEHGRTGIHALGSNSTITSSKVITALNDTNSNELLKVTATTDAVNELTLANAATATNPTLSATGGDTNIGITLTPKGTGTILTDSLYPWQRGTGTWTYASATTFTVPTVDAALMQAGTKIWLTQTTSKYFYVTGVSGTTITINGGSDYTLTNAAITAPYFSNAQTPVGFPGEFAYTPTWSGGVTAIGNATVNFYFNMNGPWVNVRFKVVFGTTSTFSTTTFYASLPMTAHSEYANNANGAWCIGESYMEDRATSGYPGSVSIPNSTISNNTTKFQFLCSSVSGALVVSNSVYSTSPFTWATTDFIQGTLAYMKA